MKRLNWVILGVVLVLLLVGGGYFLLKDSSGFDLSTVFLKSVVKNGESVDMNVQITNIVNQEQSFDILVKGLPMVSLNKNHFTLGAEESFNLVSTFLGNEPGVYVGKMIVSAGEETKEILVIFEVQSKNVAFASSLDVSSQYKEVEQGDSISTGLKILNLADTNAHALEISYTILNLDSEEVFSEKEISVVESQAEIVKTITLPEKISFGDYVFAILIKDETSVTTSSYVFSVVSDKKSVFDIDKFTLVVVLFLIGILFLVFFMVWERRKLIVELRRQHSDELRFLDKKLKEQKIKAISKARSSSQKRFVSKLYSKIKKRAVKRVKERQKKQDREFKNLRKKKKKTEMQKKLEMWKKKGFDVGDLIQATKQEKKSVNEKLSDWKNQGYDTSVLKKI